MLAKLVRAARYALSVSPSGLGKELRHRFYTRHYERKLNIVTKGVFEQSELGYTYADGKVSSPIGYEHVFWALDRIPFPPTEVEMMDFGAGLGRAVLAAATRPYRRVLGVELSAVLAPRAHQNLARLRGRQAATVEIILGDVLNVPIPPTINVFYFFNPFEGRTLERAVEKIRLSLEKHPRPAFVIFFNHRHMEKAVQGQHWIRKIYEGEFYPEYGCALYEVPAMATAVRTQAATAG